MRLSLIATLAFFGLALAQNGGGDQEDEMIPIGGDCKKDGSMGNCENGFCLQLPDEDTGVCKPEN